MVFAPQARLILFGKDDVPFAWLVPILAVSYFLSSFFATFGVAVTYFFGQFGLTITLVGASVARTLSPGDPTCSI